MQAITQIDDTRGKILNAALCSLEQLGMSKLGITDIADYAGVSRSTIYHHFTNKEEVLEAAFLRITRDFCFELTARLDHSSTANEKLSCVLTTIFNTLTKSPYYDVLTDPGIFHLIQDLLLRNTEAQSICHYLFACIYKGQRVDETRLAEMSDVVIRIVLSYLTNERAVDSDAKQLSELVIKWVSPLVPEVLAH